MLPSYGFGQQNDFDKTAIGPFENYCDGYGMPGAKGPGYVNVLKVSTGQVKKSNDLLIDGIVAYDRAEAKDAYIGQINMLTASSFNGLTGSIWGYDLAVAEEIQKKEQKPLFTIKQYDGSPLPVFDAAPLLKAGRALFGTEKERRFPPAPGGHVVCANKSVVAFRPENRRPIAEKGEAYGVWCYLAISIAKDRKTGASLFIEDAGPWNKNDNEQDLVRFLKEHRKIVASSIVACGEDQHVVYERTYMSFAYEIMKPGYVGTALTVTPYVVLAQKAVPEGNFKALEKMNLAEWEKAVGFK
ncbi:MAG: histidine decarboxylase, pyruvoyl type [Proteobacteria bacterium]|nr:histidine decarboxylase, pyruvoyl type [Pseudomonadota bacterium]